MRVRADLLVSLDGIAATADGTDDNPLGADFGRIAQEYAETRTFRERVFDKTDGSGTTGMDDAYAQRYFEGIGAEIMGAGKFGLHVYPDDPAWRGWWGEAPPFRYPAFVLTHERREPIEFANGTSFTFISTAPEDALAAAAEVAAGQDVRIGGGVTTFRSFFDAGLIDEIHLAVAPVVIENGRSVWAGLRGIEENYSTRSETAPSGVTHITMTR